MASQPAVGVQLDMYEIRSFVRGAQAFPLYWQSNACPGNDLRLQKEPQNVHDRHAVSVVAADGAIVGHVPFNLSPVISSFLTREFNKGLVEITGKQVNQGAGYGLEVPCIYLLYGPTKYTQVLQTTTAKLQERSLV